MIVRSYDDWIEDAPEEYKSDDMFQARIPVAITSRFGQNQELASSVDLRDEELENGAHDQDYARIKYVTLMLATHIWYAHVYRAEIWMLY